LFRNLIRQTHTDRRYRVHDQMKELHGWAVRLDVWDMPVLVACDRPQSLKLIMTMTMVMTTVS